MTLILKILTRQRELLAKGWTKFYSACDANGAVAPFDSKQACCWCFAGALWYAEHEAGVSTDFHFDRAGDGAILGGILDRVLRRMHNRSDWIGFNDDFDTTQAMVLAYVDECIKEAT